MRPLLVLSGINQFRDAVHSRAWGLVVTLDLKTHLNRLVRTRMLGGGAARSNPGPYAHMVMPHFRATIHCHGEHKGLVSVCFTLCSAVQIGSLGNRRAHDRIANHLQIAFFKAALH